MKPWLADADVSLYHGDAIDALSDLPTGSADAVVTSPPYLDARPEYPSPNVAEFNEIFYQLHRITNEGPLALNVGRIHRNGAEQLWWLDLITAATAVGYRLRDTLIWVKPNANPIKGPVLADSHEYVFLFGDDFNTDAVRTGYAPDSEARLRRRWISSISVKGDTSERNGARRAERRGERHEPDERGARGRSFFVSYVGRDKGNPHPAPMATELAEHLVKLTSRAGETVIDPFAGSGTTMVAARLHQRASIGIDRDSSYLEMAAKRLSQQSLLVDDAA